MDGGGFEALLAKIGNHRGTSVCPFGFWEHWKTNLPGAKTYGKMWFWHTLTEGELTVAPTIYALGKDINPGTCVQ